MAALSLLLPQLAGYQFCGEWAAGGQPLYFTPITCPYAYATLTNQTVGVVDTSDAQVRIVPCRPDWGFRLFGTYLSDCTFAGVSYQWFEVTTTQSSTMTGIPGGQVGGAGRGVAQQHIGYQNVDVRVGTYLLQGCASAFYLYGNARWVDLSHRRSVNYLRFLDGSTELFTEKSGFAGGAIGIGVGGELDIWCGLGAFLDGNVLGVIGNRSLTNVKYRQAGVQVRNLRLSYPSDTCVIPEVDVRIGLNYTYACGCGELVGELGYEVDYFWGGSAFPDFNGVFLVQSSRAATPVCEDLGFAGLFFGAHLIF